jgi:hypothetical protein
MHIEERLEFIDSLTLPLITSPRTFAPNDKPLVDPNKDGGSVTPDNINVYFAGVSQQNREDVDASKLLMQNAANKLFPNDDQLVDWYKYYTNGLSKIGWVLQAKQMQSYTIKKVGLTMDAVALDVLQGLIGNKAALFAELAGKAVDIVKGNEQLIRIYDSNVKVGKQTKFDIAPVWQDNDGYAQMILNCTSVDVRESTRGILWWKSTHQSTTVESGAVQTYLNPRVYEQLRAAVLQKLGQGGKDFIAQLPDF